MRKEELPESIGGHRVLRELGRGAVGVVYLAEQASLKRLLAIKVLFGDAFRDQDFVERFRREGQIAARLRHPNIVQIFDFSDKDDLFYIAMEYAGSRSLKDVIHGADGGLPLAQALKYTDQLLAALDHAHSLGIVHRDIKPANVLVSDTDQVVLTDFSIAQMASNEQLTQTGVMLGTPEYMSPEQFDAKHVDGRADLYATAIMLYEMLVGSNPFALGSVPQVLKAQLFETPTPPHRLDESISEALSMVVMKSLDKLPQNRYQSADEMRRAVALAGAGAPPTVSPARPQSEPEVEPKIEPQIEPATVVEKPSRRGPRRTAGLLVGAAALFGLVGTCQSMFRPITSASPSPSVAALSPAPSLMATATVAATPSPTSSPSLTPKLTPTSTPAVTPSASPSPPMASPSARLENLPAFVQARSAHARGYNEADASSTVVAQLPPVWSFPVSEGRRVGDTDFYAIKLQSGLNCWVPSRDVEPAAQPKPVALRLSHSQVIFDVPAGTVLGTLSADYRLSLQGAQFLERDPWLRVEYLPKKFGYLNAAPAENGEALKFFSAPPVPSPDTSGDFNSREHRYWEVVDPDPAGFNGRLVGGEGEDPNTWPVVCTFHHGEILTACTSEGLNVLLLKGRGAAGNWLKVRAGGQDCVVRYNKNFVAPAPGILQTD